MPLPQPGSTPLPLRSHLRRIRRRGSLRWALGGLLTAGALLGACATATPTPPAAPVAEVPAKAASGPAKPKAKAIAPELALATFDEAWQRVHDTHFDPQFNGVDWIALREELRPQAAAAANAEELRSVLREMLGRLGQSHFGIIAGEEFEVAAEFADASAERSSRRRSGGSGGPGFLGLEARLVGDQPVVVRVDPEGPAAAVGVQPGMRILSIDGRSPQPLLRILESDPANPMLRYEANAMLAAALSALEGEEISLELDEQGEGPLKIAVAAATPPWEMTGMGNLPPMPTSLSARSIDERDLSELGLEPQPGDEIGLIAFSVWLTPIAPAFDKAIDRFRESLGIVIDLRGNPGGLGAMVMGMGGHFFTRPTSLGTMSTRESEIHFRVNPRRTDSAGRLVEPLDLPVAILVDEMSASTSEIFAGGMQEARRARIFGRTTPGAALPATATSLPNGDVLMAAVADFTTPKGVRLEGRGVVPDEPIELDPARLATGIDPDLAAACRWILDLWLPAGEDGEIDAETPRP